MARHWGLSWCWNLDYKWHPLVYRKNFGTVGWYRLGPLFLDWGEDD